MKYQVTIYQKENKRKPISTIVSIDSTDKSEITTKGIIQICNKRYWTKKDLVSWGYTKVKYREFIEK